MSDIDDLFDRIDRAIFERERLLRENHQLLRDRAAILDHKSTEKQHLAEFEARRLTVIARNAVKRKPA